MFGASATEDRGINEKIKKAKSHLQQHQLDLPADVPKKTEELFAKVKIPRLLGRNVEEHFENIGTQQAVCSDCAVRSSCSAVG